MTSWAGTSLVDNVNGQDKGAGKATAARAPGLRVARPAAACAALAAAAGCAGARPPASAAARRNLHIAAGWPALQVATATWTHPPATRTWAAASFSPARRTSPTPQASPSPSHPSARRVRPVPAVHAARCQRQVCHVRDWRRGLLAPHGLLACCTTAHVAVRLACAVGGGEVRYRWAIGTTRWGRDVIDWVPFEGANATREVRVSLPGSVSRAGHGATQQPPCSCWAHRGGAQRADRGALLVFVFFPTVPATCAFVAVSPPPLSI